LKQVAEIELELSHAQQEIERRKKAEKERDNVIQELKKTLSEVKKLRGFLPICSICKNIRDDQGYWNKIESYIRDRSEAEFSHSIYPECAKKHYPDLDIYVE
jgi:DNA repair exonuclease SbcCD ATPase subunit